MNRPDVGLNSQSIRQIKALAFQCMERILVSVKSALDEKMPQDTGYRRDTGLSLPYICGPQSMESIYEIVC